MWNKNEDGFGLRMIDSGLPEQVSEKWYLCEPRDSGEVLGLRIFEHTAHEVSFAFPQPDNVLDLPLADDRLSNAADVCVTSH